MNNIFNFKIWWKEVDKINFIFISTLLLVGIILSFSIKNSLELFNKHLIFSFLSFFLMIYLSSLDEKILRRIALFSLIFSILVLFFILFLDYEIKGSKRWLRIYGFSLQSSEFIKPFYFLLSAWFIVQGINGRRFYLYILFFSFILIEGLIILQPDFGVTILFFLTLLCQLFIAGLSIYLIILSLFSLLTLCFLAYYFFDHIKNRIEIFLNPLSDTYQIDLSLSAFMSGGLFGKGPGQGILKERIPDASTDFIFAVAGEELGFIFCSLIILLILSIIIRFLLKLLKMKDPFIIIAVIGLVCCFGLQSLINIFSSLSIIPTKGMTLPFISYGGSSMISTSILFGFLLSITRTKHSDE